MIFDFLKHTCSSFLNLIYKQKCVICSKDCSKDVDLLCKNCLKDVHFLNSFASRLFLNTQIFCATNYYRTVKKLIQLLKFSHKRNCAKVLARLLFTYFKKLELKEDFIVCYPTSYFIKNTQRGYEHMELIVREFCNLANLEYKKNLIKKIKNAKPQYKARNRHKNIEGAYKINEKYIQELKDKNILIIDDITTSGATIEEIIKSFQQVGIKNLCALIISKAGC